MFEKLSTHEATFANLTPEAVATQLPQLQAPMVNIGAADPATIAANLRSECLGVHLKHFSVESLDCCGNRIKMKVDDLLVAAATVGDMTAASWNTLFHVSLDNDEVV